MKRFHQLTNENLKSKRTLNPNKT